MLAKPRHAIGLNAAAVLSGMSLRTWQRRIEQGQVPRLDGDRAQVPFAAVAPALPVALSPAEVAMLVRADQGDAAAQANVGALLALYATRATKGDKSGAVLAAAAAYFLEQAAAQDQADAMHWLAMLHAAGHGQGDAKTHDALALMWLAKAAAHGHVIARKQLAALLPHEAPAPA